MEHDTQHTHHDGHHPAAPDASHSVYHAHHGAHVMHTSTTSLATHATLHCLLGCGIGELAGLAIGVGLGFRSWETMALATVLGFLSGYTLGVWPLVRQGMGWMQAFRLIWLGETISIAVVEVAMNFIDFRIGGVQAAKVISGQFWVGYVLALPAGFLAAWPVNYWLLARDSKSKAHKLPRVPITRHGM